MERRTYGRRQLKENSRNDEKARKPESQKARKPESQKARFERFALKIQKEEYGWKRRKK